MSERPLDLSFSADGHLYASHMLHPFAARFPPPLARWAIEEHSNCGALVLDPMVGSGTTLVEAALLNRAARGVDIDPLARLIARSKAVPVQGSELRRLAEDATAAIRRDLPDPGWRPNVPGIDKWFRDDVAADLSRTRSFIQSAGVSPAVRDVLWTVFSSLIVARTSVANVRDIVHSRPHYRAWQESPDVPSRFVSKLLRAAKLMDEYNRMLGAPDAPPPDIAVASGDARRLPFAAESIDLIVTSPPYCSAIDYPRAHRLAIAWMPEVVGVTVDDYSELARDYVGTERAPLCEATQEQPLPPSISPQVDAVVHQLSSDRKRAWVVYRYFRDMRAVLSECHRVLRAGSALVLVVCPSNIRKVQVLTHRLLAALAEEATGGRLALERAHERVIHDRRRVMPYIEQAFGPRMRTEYVLVLRKAG